MLYLKGQGLWALSTLNIKRSRNCQISTPLELKRQGRGAMKEIGDAKNNSLLPNWFDNKPVLMISNFVGKEPVDKCLRYDRKEKKKIGVDRPAAIAIYNKFMGGVDKADLLLSLYRSKIRSKNGIIVWHFTC